MQEAFEELKFAHVPVGVLSEYRLWLDRELPYKVIIIPYVEHLHAKSRKRLAEFMADGGKVYVGADSTLQLAGVEKLPVAFDAKFKTWWPKDRPDEWNSRRSRQCVIGVMLERARHLRRVFAAYIDGATVQIDDPEVVYNVREAGVARYIFIINDHQINPDSPELRARRQGYNHFMLMPMRFPKARPSVKIGGSGVVYPLLGASAGPIELREGRPASIDLELDGGDGKVFVIVPKKIETIKFVSPPVRTDEGVKIRTRTSSAEGVVAASLPVRIDMECHGTSQTAYETTREGVLTWTVPFLKEFPEGTITVIVTDLASGKTDRAQTRRGG